MTPFRDESFEERQARAMRLRRKATRSNRRWRTVSDVATVGGCLLFVLFWLATVLLPLALMGAAIYYLVSNA